ncbi:MAG TPA: hypothetical protein VFZ00_03075 [Solirubrobacter sp.]|nr:hypothetical protein [Solirubrobacter sp.]
MLTAFVVAALAAGVTGAWSPCGFSMVETLAPSGYAGRLRTTAIACATFTVGALAGGVVTFGGLALLGDALGATAPAVAAVIAVAAAIGEARGARIVPQVRRQVPESWRRVMPVPLAAGLYGVLLGLGFTTFILSFAVWALAGIAVALGDPTLGVAIGLAFGAGRALPVIALAPFGGGQIHAAMAERPRILRSLRIVDAITLAICAATVAATPASAAVTAYAFGFADPTVSGPTVALHRPGGTGEIRTPTGVLTTPGNHPAVGGANSVWIEGSTVVVQGVTRIDAPGVNAVAVSGSYVAFRVGQVIYAAPLTAGAAPPQPIVAGAVGRPALAGNLLVFDIDGRIEAVDLATGVRKIMRRERRAQLRGPSVLGNQIAYVKATYKRQQVMLGPLRPQRPKSDDVLYGTTPSGRRDAGHEPGRFPARGHINKPLWARPPKGVTDTLTTTALSADAIYVTRVRKRTGLPAAATVLRVDIFAD